MAQATLLVAAIHNGELAQAPASQLMEQVNDLTTQVLEVCDQQPFEQKPLNSELRQWRKRQSELETDWAAYRGRPSSSVTSAMGRTLFSFRTEFSGSFRRDAWHVRQVERAVTGKHIVAWRRFRDSDLGELLVLESDAVATDRSREMISELLNRPADQPRYVNLAGGLEPQAIGITHLRIHQAKETNDPNDIVRYRKPVTNTSCAYLVNRTFTELALEHLDREPEDAELGIDWLFNAIFMGQEARNGPMIECLHAEPPAIVHGSTQGLTRSWHPGR